MPTERLVAVAALVFSVLTAVVAGTWIAGTTLATQEEVDRAVTAAVQPLATSSFVASEVGSIKVELAALPTRDDVADLVADAVRTGIAEAIAPLVTKEDLAELAGRVETFDAKANALIDCVIDLDGPRLPMVAPNLQTNANPAAAPEPFRRLPNSCERARDLAREP